MIILYIIIGAIIYGAYVLSAIEKKMLQKRSIISGLIFCPLMAFSIVEGKPLLTFIAFYGLIVFLLPLSKDNEIK